MKPVAQRNWERMSMHGKKCFLREKGFDTKLASSGWGGLGKDVAQQFTVYSASSANKVNQNITAEA